MEQNMPIPGTRYFDREKRQYQLMLVADHSKTNEKMAVYQALFGGFEYFTEPLGIFMTEKTEVSSEIGRTGGSKWSRPAVLQTEAANPVQDPIAKTENQKLKTEDSSVSAASSDFGGRNGKSDPAGIFRCGNIRRKVSGDQIAWKFHYKQADRRFCRCAGSCDTGRQLRQPVYAAFKQRPYDAEI